MKRLPDTLPGRVIITDDPLRAKMLAAHHLEFSSVVFELGDVLAYTGSYNGTELAVVSSGFGSSGVLSCCEELAGLGVTEIVYLGACSSADTRHGLRLVILAAGGCQNLLERANAAVMRFDLNAVVRTVQAPGALTPGALTPGAPTSEEGCIIDDVTGALYEMAGNSGFGALSILTVSESVAGGEKLEEHEIRSRFYAASRLAFEVFAI